MRPKTLQDPDVVLAVEARVEELRASAATIKWNKTITIDLAAIAKFVAETVPPNAAFPVMRALMTETQEIMKDFWREQKEAKAPPLTAEQVA